MKIKKINDDVFQVTFKQMGLEKTDIFSLSGLEQAILTWRGDAETLQLLHDIKNEITKSMKPKKEVQTNGSKIDKG